MKFNKWTVGLAAIGAVSLASTARADEKMSPVQTALSNTTLSSYVNVAATSGIKRIPVYEKNYQQTPAGNADFTNPNCLRTEGKSQQLRSG